MEDIKNLDCDMVEQLRKEYENMEAEIADSDSILDKVKNMIKSNKLAAISLIVILSFCFCAIFRSIR